jgi:glucan phosphorylase
LAAGSLASALVGQGNFDSMSRVSPRRVLLQEYGLDPHFPIYAGGLGILAGDHMKSAGDLQVPVIGIGLFWDEGYTRQVIGKRRGRGLTIRRHRATRCAVVDVTIEVTVRGKKCRCRPGRSTAT